MWKRVSLVLQCQLIKLTKSLQSQVKNEKMTKSLQSQGKSLQSQVVKNLDPLTSKLAGKNLRFGNQIGII